jgi:hypothetical protein
MIQTLIKQTQLDIESRTLNVCYYVTRTLNGGSRYSAEVEFHAEDHMILDADSVNGLETKLDSLVLASIYSRMLCGAGNAA